jgi:NAD(P)-dependent dehydrogenase (short-subunit alcohol dehydrogenase family)
MDLHLKGKTAIITGGSKGIGAGAALGLAEEGCAVTIVSRNLNWMQRLIKFAPKHMSMLAPTQRILVNPVLLMH